MAKINALSPYFVYKSETNLDSVEIDIYIYTGTQTTSRPAQPTYTLVGEALNEEVEFDISLYVRDFFDINLESGVTSQAVFVDYQTTRTVNAVVQTADAFVQLIGLYGYGLFEEGNNPQPDRLAFLAGDVFVCSGSREGLIGFDAENATLVEFLDSSGQPLYSESISAPTTDAGVIKYIRLNGNAEDSIKRRSTVYRHNPVLDQLNCHFDITSATRFSVTDGTNVETYPIVKYAEVVYDAVEVIFVNKYGAFQSLYFFKRSTKSIKVKKSDYNRNIRSGGTYNTTRHNRRTLQTTSEISYKLNSGYYTEKANDAFAQLLESEFVWLNINNSGDYIPVMIEDTAFTYKTSLDDKLINYEMTFKGAFNKTNQVR